MHKCTLYEGNVLEIRVEGIIRFLSLFSYDHRITIDPNAQEVTIDNQLFYVASSKTISFSDCWYVDYEYTSTRTKHGSTDYYPIALVTRNEKRFPICTVKGQDSSHLLMGIHLSTGNDDQSRDLVNAIAKLINIPIGKPVAEDMEKKECCSCGRTITAITKKCLYCGTLQEN